ncbi:MAG TPA: DUF4173 domain-containing protein [Candidatus Limnocylindria bacterium]|nr:DUF4173 domain-containing protein [Candidatus Limnocylindria bacterium]
MRSATLTLFLAAVVGVAAQLLFFAKAPGINAAIAALLFVGVVLAVRRPALVDLWLPVGALAFAGLVAIRSEPAVVAFDALAAAGLAVATAASASRRITTLPLLALAREAGEVLGAVSVRAGGLIARARGERAALGPRYRSAAAYAGGLVLAVPFLVAFTALFSSADAVFARWAEDLLDPRLVRELPGRTVLAGAVAWVAAGALTLAARSGAAHEARGPHRPARAETALALLLPIDALFSVFVVLQAAYLFGGRDTVEAAGIPYSAYARRGFFELVGAASLVAAALFAVDLLARRTRLVVAAALALLPLTGVVLASAAYRLALYQEAYGWSELRLYALAATLFLGLTLAILGTAIVARRMDRAVQPVAAAALAVALAVNAVGPAGHIARANLDRAASGPSDERALRVDLWYLVSLGDGAVPELVARLPALPERERFCLTTLLRWSARWRDLDRPGPWQSLNLDRERAQQALLAVRDELFAPVVPPRDDHTRSRERAIETRYGAECAAAPEPGRR